MQPGLTAGETTGNIHCFQLLVGSFVLFCLCGSQGRHVHSCQEAAEASVIRWVVPVVSSAVGPRCFSDTAYISGG